MVLTIIIAKIGIELACRKPIYIGHDENRTASQIYLSNSN